VVQAPRIAWHDLSARLARPLLSQEALAQESNSFELVRRLLSEELIGDGFRVLPSSPLA
jgi:hypothetical protein